MPGDSSPRREIGKAELSLDPCFRRDERSL